MESAREKKASPRVKRLVETAQELFSRYGIKRVSVEEICRDAGVSKMTFYRYFPNKTAMARYIVGAIFTEEKKRFNSILSMDISFEEKIRKVLIAKIEFSNKYSKEFINELIMGSDPELKKYIKEESMKSHDIKGIFSDAQKNGDIRSDIKIEFILYMFNVMRKAIRDENLQKLYPDFASFMKDVFNFFYYGVLAR